MHLDPRFGIRHLCCPRLARRAALVWLSLLQRRSDQTGLCLKVRPAWPARSVIWDCLWRDQWAQTTVTPFCHSGRLAYSAVRLGVGEPRRTHAASLHVRLRRPLPGLRAGRRLLRAHGGHLLLQCHDANAPFLWSSPGRVITPSSRAVAFCGSYPRRVWAPFYSAGGSGGVRARSPAAIRA